MDLGPFKIKPNFVKILDGQFLYFPLQNLVLLCIKIKIPTPKFKRDNKNNPRKTDNNTKTLSVYIGLRPF